MTLEINSPGGYVDSGSEIYTALKNYSGKITANIVGKACSSASWIALAADHVAISPAAQMMIHRASTASAGNSDDMASALHSLDSMDSAFVDLYAKKTGKSAQEIYQMMCKTTWMNAKEAVENGFADEIMFENELAMTNADGSLSISPSMINKVKNLIAKSKMSGDDNKPTQDQKDNSKEGQAKNNLSLLLWN